MGAEYWPECPNRHGAMVEVAPGRFECPNCDAEVDLAESADEAPLLRRLIAVEQERDALTAALRDAYDALAHLPVDTKGAAERARDALASIEDQ